MNTVDEAFAKLKSNLEITKSEQELASRRQTEIREHLDGHFDLDRSFLTGSYSRHTKTKKLKDVDIFCVLKADGDDAGLRDKSPWEVLNELQAALLKRYNDPIPTIGRRSCTVQFSIDDEVPSFDIVLAFDRAGGGFEIPDRDTGEWIASDPSIHKAEATRKNGECGGGWIPLVKMVKGFNREWEKPVKPSFLLEVMALDIVRPPFGSYQDEMVLILANARDRIEEGWPDPARLGPDVNSTMSGVEKINAKSRLSEAHAVAERAVQLEDEGKGRAAVDKWRELFGNRMPKP